MGKAKKRENKINTIRIQTYWSEDWHRRWLWTPVFMGVGIGFYLWLSVEPCFLWALILFLSLCLKWARKIFFPFVYIVFGFLIVNVKTHFLDTKMIQEATYGVLLEGKMTQVETLPSNEQRIILKLKNDTKVRLKVKGGEDLNFRIGDKISGKGHLFPFSPPLIEGSYNFKRQAFFQGLSAQGVLRADTISIKSTSYDWSLEGLRRSLTERIYGAISGEKGAIVAALITGEKTKIPKSVRDDYTNSGLSHILAISGLHVGLVAGFIFFLLRNVLALIPTFALKFHTKKIAAFLCIPLLLFYMAISGFGTPVVRSFLMTSIVLLGVMYDRISISMNLVAVAALVVLILFPESLVHPSFQLSFAAVFALISVYESDWVKSLQKTNSFFKQVVLYGLALALTSVIATLATFPLTIATFNRITLHAIEANMIGVPLMGIWIMPLGVCSLILMPFGLESLALVPMGWGISFLNIIAHEVGNWHGSNIIVPTPSLWALNMVVFSVLWMGIWKSKWRFWSLPFLCIGIYGFVFPSHAKPDLLFDPAQKVWAFFSKDTLFTYPESSKKFEIELWARVLGAKNISIISKDDARFKCFKTGCVLKNYDVFIAFSKYSKKQYKGQVLSFFPQRFRSPYVKYFQEAAQGFIVQNNFVFKPALRSLRPWR